MDCSESHLMCLFGRILVRSLSPETLNSLFPFPRCGGLLGRPFKDSGLAWDPEYLYPTDPDAFSIEGQGGQIQDLAIVSMHDSGFILLQGHTESPTGPPSNPTEGHLSGSKSGTRP